MVTATVSVDLVVHTVNRVSHSRCKDLCTSCGPYRTYVCICRYTKDSYICNMQEKHHLDENNVIHT